MPHSITMKTEQHLELDQFIMDKHAYHTQVIYIFIQKGLEWRR